MKNLISISTLILFSILFTACNGSGGGGDDNTQAIAPIKKAYHLDEGDEMEPGFLARFDLTGKSSTGHNVEGVYILKRLTEEAGYIPIQAYLSLTLLPDGVPVSSVMTSYYDQESKALAYMYDETNHKTYQVTEHGDTPDMAYIGDFGKTDTITDSDGETQTGTWRIEEAGSGRALYIRTTTTKTASGDVISYTTVKSEIDTTGYTHSISLTAFYADSGLKVDLSGKRATLRR